MLSERIIPSRSLEDNTNISHSSVGSELTFKRDLLPAWQFKEANKLKQMWITATIQECKLRGNETRVLEALVFLTDPVNGVGMPAIGTIQEHIEKRWGAIGYDTVRKILLRLEAKGAIKIMAGGFKKPNTYVLQGYEYKLANRSCDSPCNLNNLNLCDQDLNTYYSEYENSVSKEKVVRGSRTANKAADLEKLNGPNPETEVTRVCLAWALTETQTEYAVKRMRHRDGMVNAARFLCWMAQGLKAGTWNTSTKKGAPARNGAVNIVPGVEATKLINTFEITPEEAERSRAALAKLKAQLKAMN